MEETIVVDVANGQLRRFAIVGTKHRLVQLPHEMLLKRFLRGNGIEKKLPFIVRLLGTARVAARLRHVIAPLIIEFRQLIEFFLEFLVRSGLGIFALVRRRLVRKLFQHRISFHLLLHQVAQLEQRGLENQETLLELRRKDLLQRKILRLMHALTGHVRSLATSPTRGKQFTRRTCPSKPLLPSGSGTV